jgi:hypothetical protein
MTLAVGVGALTGAGTLAPAAFAAGVAPTGAYALNVTSIWAAQTVQLTQTALTDDVDPAESVTRKVTWGDGSSGELEGAATKLRHAYTKVGTYTVAVALTDTEGNTAPGTFTGTAIVKVTATPGTSKVKTAIAYTGTRGASAATITLAGIPSTVSRVKIHWGDGNWSTEKRTAKTATWYYRSSGTKKVSVALETANGESAPKAAGSIKVIKDGTGPSVTIKKPSKPNKASSWKSITGTASDKASGMDVVQVFAIQWRGSTAYYFRFKTKTWKSYNSERPVPSDGYKFVTVAKGKWKVSLTGIKKGIIQVDAIGWDKVNNPGTQKWVEATVTA